MSIPFSPTAIIPAFAGLFGKNKVNDVPHRIYGAVVAQARNSVLYTDFAIPDTPMGRSDMLALHVFLLNHRLKDAGDNTNNRCNGLSQKIFDLFVNDLDRGLRDIGFADASVHKRKRRLVRSYYAVIDEFDRPLSAKMSDKNTKNLAGFLGERYFSMLKHTRRDVAAARFADYLLSQAKSLSMQTTGEILNGNLDWPTELPTELKA